MTIHQEVTMITTIEKVRVSFLKYIVILFLFSVLTFTSNAQSMNGWYGAGIEFELSKKIDLDFDIEARTNFDYGLSFYQYFPEISLSYKINKRFDVSASYRFLRSKEDNLSFYNRHKYYFNFSFDFPIERFTVKNRARYQLQNRQYIEDETDRLPDNYFRDKLEISYNINNNPADPFIAFEVFYPVNQYKINTIDEYRVIGGVEFPLSKKQSMELGIMYNVERFPRPEKAVVFLIGYGFSAN